MIRNLKALVLTLGAACAMSGIAVPPASAGMFTASEYPAAVSATYEGTIGSENEYFESIGRKIECQKVQYTGSLSEATSEMIASIDVIDHTQGGNCRAGGTLVMTVEEHGCQYIIQVAEATESDHRLGVAISCPAGKTIITRVRNLLNSADACTITIAPQTTTGTLTTSSGGSGHVNVSGQLEFKQVIHSSNTAICGVEAGKSQESTTKYVINKALTVTSSGKTISVSG